MDRFLLSVQPMKILAMAGSLRTGSYNRKLLNQAVAVARAQGNEVTIVDLKDFQVPYYDGDVEDAVGIPELARKLARIMGDHDAIVLASPEYNHSFPGHLKNTIDWISRLKDVPLEKKPTLFLSASPGMAGGTRSLWSLRVPFEILGAYVYPEMMSVSKAHQQFNADDTFSDPKNLGRLQAIMTGFFEFSRRLNSNSAIARQAS